MYEPELTIKKGIPVSEILEHFGWALDSEIPLEIIHEESNSVATNIAAEMIIDELSMGYEEFLRDDDESDDD
jgi:hypothetical protein